MEGRIWLGLNVVIRIGDALILVDPGMDDPDSAWQRDRPRLLPDWVVKCTPGLDVAVNELRMFPGDVTHVVITPPMAITILV